MNFKNGRVFFRKHRELLEDSMKTQVELFTLQELFNLLDTYSKDGQVSIKTYCFDYRNNQETYLVSSDKGVIGFIGIERQRQI